MKTLTADDVELLRTPKGGFNQETMEIIGAWPLSEGWMARLVGSQVSDRKWKAALQAKSRERHFFRGNTRRSH